MGSVGALLGGKLGEMLHGFIYPFLEKRDVALSTTEFDVSGYQIKLDSETKVLYAAVVVLGAVGGALLVRYSDELIDLACGAVGAYLVAQNCVDQISSSEWNTYIVAGIILVILPIRHWHKEIRAWLVSSCEVASKESKAPAFESAV